MGSKSSRRSAKELGSSSLSTCRTCSSRSPTLLRGDRPVRPAAMGPETLGPHGAGPSEFRPVMKPKRPTKAVFKSIHKPASSFSISLNKFVRK